MTETFEPGQPAMSEPDPAGAPPPEETVTAWPPLAGLVAAGTITVEQSEAVRQALLTAPTAKPQRGRLLAEVGMYLGAALVLLGLIVYIGSQWADLSRWSRAGLLTGTALVCIVVAIVIVAASSATWASLREPVHDATRRLVSVLLTLAVAALGGALASAVAQPALNCGGFGCLLADRVNYFGPLAAASAVTFGLYIVVRWLAPTPFSELGWFTALMITVGLLCAAFADNGETVALAVGIVALAWAVLAATTHLLFARQLSLALGMGTAAITVIIFAGIGSGWHWVPLALLLVGSIVAYVVTAYWQFLGAAAIATVGGAIVYVNREVADSVTGFVLVVIIAGLILVAFGALAFVITTGRRKKKSSIEPAADATEQAELPA